MKNTTNTAAGTQAAGATGAQAAGAPNETQTATGVPVTGNPTPGGQNQAGATASSQNGAAPQNGPGATASPITYRLEHVVKEFRLKRRVVRPLRDVNVTVRPGEFVTIQGMTGGGKSTLLQLLGALERPTFGVLEFGGVNLASAPDSQLQAIRAREIGFVFQNFNLIPTLTAAENVDMGLEPLGLPAEERKARVSQVLAELGLGDRADHRPNELSGGQQQRVAIARAIVKHPRVLLADEPTGNLDERMRDDILAILQHLNAAGLTLVVVTHDSAVAHRAGRPLMLANGMLHSRE